MTLQRKLQAYYLTAVLGLIMAIAGFAYNTWRLERSETNSTTRTAAFETFKALATLEQIIYALHYDQDSHQGSPRKAWVEVGLIRDLSVMVSPQVNQEAAILHALWQEKWPAIEQQRSAVDAIVTQIDAVRAATKLTLLTLD